MNRHFLVSLAAVAGILWCGAAEAVPQAFVQSDGSDASVRRGCTVARPCRTFAAAMTVVDDGGEVVALDTEDYGPVTITKSVAIIGNAGASIVATSPTGVGVDIVKAGVNVVLRGLDINGYGVGFAGVSMRAGSSLQVEKCVFSNFVGHGLVVTTPASVRVVDSLMRGNSNGARIQGGATADIVNSRFIGNRGAGLLVQADTAATTSATVSDSVASSNSWGFELDSANASGIGRMVVTGSTAAHNKQGFLASASAGNAVMTVGHSTAAHNAIGFAQFPGVAGTSNIETLGDNTVRQNDTATIGLIVVVPPM